jgi:hypothetical protein
MLGYGNRVRVRAEWSRESKSKHESRDLIASTNGEERRRRFVRCVYRFVHTCRSSPACWHISAAVTHTRSTTNGLLHLAHSLPVIFLLGRRSLSPLRGPSSLACSSGEQSVLLPPPPSNRSCLTQEHEESAYGGPPGSPTWQV